MEELLIGNKKYKIGFEYIGLQHYKFPNHVYKTKKQFQYYQIVDKVKKKLWEENDVKLIEFPFDVDVEMNHPSKIQSYIINEFEKETGINLNNFNVPQYDHRSPEFGQYRLDNFL